MDEGRGVYIYMTTYMTTHRLPPNLSGIFAQMFLPNRLRSSSASSIETVLCRPHTSTTYIHGPLFWPGLGILAHHIQDRDTFSSSRPARHTCFHSLIRGLRIKNMGEMFYCFFVYFLHKSGRLYGKDKDGQKSGLTYVRE
jgi:hypothetical protein